MRHKTFRMIFGGLLMIGLLLGGTLAQAGQNLVQITVVGDSGHNQKPWEWYKNDFAQKFGVDLKIVGVPFGQVYEKEKIEFVTHTGAYDIITFYPKYLGDYAGSGYLVNLEGYAKELDPKMEDVTAGYREFYCKYGGTLYAVPYDGDVLNLYYRKDLLDNQEEKTAFKAEYGYQLRAPETWDEYLDVAKFFTRKAGEKLAGETLKRDFYGTSEYGQRDWVWAWWGNRFASLGGVYFDVETMEPRINSEVGVKALKMLKEAYQYAPPEILSFGYEECKDAFLNGDTAMVIQWPCVGKKGADPEQSKIVGRIGLSHVPGVSKGGEVYYRALMPCGRVLAINKDSEHPWKAYQIIRYVSVVTSIDDVSTAKTGLDPYRHSHFAHPEEYEMFPTVKDAEIYLAGVKKNMEHGYPELLMPGAGQYEDVLGLEITEALAGQKSVEDALNDAAKEWAKITKRFGLERQKEIYQSLVKGWKEAGLW